MLSADIFIKGNRAVARSYAKINLTLDVLGRLENGYHQVEMLMQTVNLFDLVIVDKDRSQIQVSTNLKYLPVNEKNIAYKACVEFFRHTGISGGARVLIHKNIPVAAGLAGGSGNAAAVLCALNLLYDAGLSPAELCRIGLRLGADVPYCILGGTQLATGLGEQLTPVAPMPKTITLLVKPPISISTAAIYEKIDSVPLPAHPDLQGMLAALEQGDRAGIAGTLYNVMEQVTAVENPVLGGIKKKLLANGALGACMSGSGPTVFGLFDDYEKAKASADSFARMYKDVYLTHTL